MVDLNAGFDGRGEVTRICAMRGLYLGILGALIVAGCGPSYRHPVKTPEQLVDEQEQLGNQEAKSNDDTAAPDVGEDTDDEKKRVSTSTSRSSS